VDLRGLFSGIFYVLRTGCTWGDTPQIPLSIVVAPANIHDTSKQRSEIPTPQVE